MFVLWSATERTTYACDSERERAVCVFMYFQHPTPSHSHSSFFFSSLLFFHITYSLSTFSSSTNHQHVHFSLYLQQSSSSSSIINRHNLTTFSSLYLTDHTTYFKQPFSPLCISVLCPLFPYLHLLLFFSATKKKPHFLQTFSLGCLFS